MLSEKKVKVLILSAVAVLAMVLPAYGQDNSVRDSLRMKTPAVGVNLAWAGISAPNLSFELPVGQHFSAGVSGGLKAWPRWNPADMDNTPDTKWRHLAVVPYFRWWPKATFKGFFLGTDLMYAHYNVSGIELPWGIYPDIASNRLQGDFYGAGLSLGCSVWITRHLNLVLSAGALGGYKNATKYECPHCGMEVGKAEGFDVAPKLDVSIAYHIFNQKRAEKKER